MQILLTFNSLNVRNLWILKCDLYNRNVNNPKNTPPSIFGGIKHHHIERHDVYHKKCYGSEDFIYNTQLSENRHLICKSK